MSKKSRRKYRNYYDKEGRLMKAVQSTKADVCYYDKELTILMSRVAGHSRMYEEEIWVKTYLKIPSSQRANVEARSRRLGITDDHESSQLTPLTFSLRLRGIL